MSQETITVTQSNEAIARPETPKPMQEAKKGRRSKYATPEEAHAAKLEQMRKWRQKKKAEKLAAQQANAENSQSNDEVPAQKAKEFTLTLKFNSDEERKAFMSKYKLSN